MASKKWLVRLGILSLVFQTVAVLAWVPHLSGSGVYLGLQGGYGNNHYNSDLFQDNEVREYGPAGRIYMGNQFNEYLALELGGTFYSNSHIHHDFGLVRTSDIELLARLGAPILCSPVRVDLKVGLADSFADVDPTDLGITAGIKHDFTTEIRPVVGLGIMWNVTTRFALDISYLHMFGNPTSESHVAPNNDFVALGFSVIFRNP